MKRTFPEFLKEEWESDNMLPPALSAQDAINFLKDYLLGENWYVPYSCGAGQANTEIVYDILDKYSKRFRKEKKKLLKESR